MARTQPVAGLLLALCITGALAAKNDPFFADLLASSKVKVKTASGGYSGYASRSELSCMSQLNFKSCRYTGCPECLWSDALNAKLTGGSEPGIGPGMENEDFDYGLTNLFFQTDFSCCPKEQYGYNDDVGVGYSDKVGTCDWEVSVYRWPNIDGVSQYAATGTGLNTELTPVLTDDGNAVKFGTAWGTCYLNAEAEHCDSPLCERMAISIQGGLYVARAYGDSAEKTVPVLQETCKGDAPNVNFVYPEGILPVTEPEPPVRAPQDAAAAKLAASGKQVGSGAETPPNLFPNGFFDPFVKLIMKVGGDILGCSQAMPPVLQKGSGKQGAKKAHAQQDGEEEYAYESATKLYPGCAMIISGPFYVVSKHDDKLSETGLFEFSPIFYPTEGAEPVYEPAERWPMVRGKGAKIRFTHENDNYDGGNKEYRESRDPARDEYRGYYENKKEKPNRQ